MAVDFGTKQKTLCGYHKRDTNEFGLIEGQYPILTNESDSTFLLTRDHFFSITTPQITKVLNNFQRYEKFNNIKRIISNILVFPGLLIAIGLILKMSGLLETQQWAIQFLEGKWSNVFFGLSILGIILLWHDYYEDKSHPIQLPKTKNIPQKDIDEIKATGFKFARYAHVETISFASEQTLNLLCQFSKGGNFNTLELYKHILETDYFVQQMIRRVGLDITPEEIIANENISTKTIPTYPVTSIRSILTYATEEALITNSKQLDPLHIFLAITRIFPALQKYLQENNINIDLMREVVVYNNYIESKKARSKYLDPNIPYYRKGGIAGQWIYGYTFILGKFSKDLNEKVADSQDIFGIGHDDEIENLVSVLGKITNKNALLIGEAGVGKSSLILGVAQRINSGNVPVQLKDKRIVQLDLNGLIAQSLQTGNMEELIMKAMKELENAGNTILYIDEMQEIIPAKAEESNHSIAGILLPYILNSKFPIVGTINYADYKKYLYTNESLRQSFTNIEVKEVGTTDTMRILETKIPELEKNFGCYITFPALSATVELAKRYVKDKKLPSSAVQTIEATCSWAQSNEIAKITAEHVSKTVSLQKNINVTDIDEEESNKLRKLEDNIRSKVIGQDEAVIAITESLRRARADVRAPNKPIGVFLFLGPTGVGKTHLAKVVGEEFFNSKQDIIRVDMSEYQDISSIDKFLGTNGKENIMGQTGLSLVDKIKANPYTVVLFDEIEKAHPQILDLFLQIFDEGRLTSNSGETVDFTNAIIISTSNIGSKILLDSLQQDSSLWDEAKNRAMLELRQSIRPELLNRFDKVIVFQPHNIDNLTKIANLLLEEFAKRMGEKNINITWAEQIPMLIANKAMEPGMGARPLKRYIQDKIEGQIAKGIIEGTLQSGTEVSIKESWII